MAVVVLHHPDVVAQLAGEHDQGGIQAVVQVDVLVRRTVQL